MRVIILTNIESINIQVLKYLLPAGITLGSGGTRAVEDEGCYEAAKGAEHGMAWGDTTATSFSNPSQPPHSPCKEACASPKVLRAREKADRRRGRRGRNPHSAVLLRKDDAGTGWRPSSIGTAWTQGLEMALTCLRGLEFPRR